MQNQTQPQQTQALVPSSQQASQSISFDVDEFTPQIVKPSLAEITNPNGSMWGFEDQDRDDLIIPRRAIVQKDNTVTGAKAGTFSSSISTETVNQIIAVAFSYKKTMLMFPKPFNKDSEPLCKSSNGRTPDLVDFPNPPSPVCIRLKSDGHRDHVCPMSQFGADGKAPACQLYYNFLMCDIENASSFMISFHGMAIKPIKQFITSLSEKSRAFRLPMHSFRFKMSIKLVSNNAGNAYVPVFEDIRPLVDPYQFHGQAASLRSFDVAQYDDTSDAADDDGGNSGSSNSSAAPSSSPHRSAPPDSQASSQATPHNDDVPPHTDADAPPPSVAAPSGPAQGSLPMGFASSQFQGVRPNGQARSRRATR